MPRERNKNIYYRFDPQALAELREYFLTLSEDEQEDLIHESNDEEAHWAFHLVRAGLIEPNIFCSADWLQEFEERYKEIARTPSLLSEVVYHLISLGSEFERIADQPESNYPAPPSMAEAMQTLEQQWHEIDDLSHDGFNWRESENDIPNHRNLTPVHAFLDTVIRGRYPTPEIMFSIAKAFELYFIAAGELTLEEVFFGKPRRRSGNFASRSIRELRYLFFHDTLQRQMAIASVLGKKYSILEEASNFLSHEYMDEEGKIGHFDVDSFLRGYRRWRKEFEAETGREDQ